MLHYAKSQIKSHEMKSNPTHLNRNHKSNQIKSRCQTNDKWKVMAVICGMTACTPASAPGPTLANEYWRTLPTTALTGPATKQTHFKQQNFEIKIVLNFKCEV